MAERVAAPLVVDLGADCPIRYRDRCWIAVPLRAIAAVAPRPGQAEEANVLQHAVLGFLRTGLRDPGELGKLMGLRGELVEIVMGDLRANAWIDEHEALTDAGLLAIREPAMSLDYVQMWTFQEPWRGQLLPRFTDDLEPAQVVTADRDRVRVLIGPAGNPREIQATIVRPRDDACYRPFNHEDLAKAYGDYLDHARRRATYDRAAAEAALREPHVVAVPGREREVLALTFCFTSDQLPVAREWDVADPTGLWWLGPLSDCIRRDESRGRSGAISKLLRGGRPETDVAREQRRRDLGARIDGSDPRPVADPDALADAWAGANEALIAADEAYAGLVAEIAERGRHVTRFARHLARALDAAAGRVLALSEEALRQTLASSAGAPPAELRFSLLRAELEAYSRAAHAIGFRELPEVLVVRGRRRVGLSSSSAARGGVAELVLENLRRAATDPHHALRTLAERDDGLLVDLATLLTDDGWQQRLELKLIAASSDGDSGADPGAFADACAGAIEQLRELAATVAVGDASREMEVLDG